MCGGFSAPAVSYCGVRAENFRHIAHREHVIALEPLGKGMLGARLRYDYESPRRERLFSGVPSPKIRKDMVNLAAHILKTKETKFDPRKCKDEYDQALKKLFRRKAKGRAIEEPPPPERTENVINMPCGRALVRR
jgi:DNA end-binding protein Ku